MVGATRPAGLAGELQRVVDEQAAADPRGPGYRSRRPVGRPASRTRGWLPDAATEAGLHWSDGRLSDRASSPRWAARPDRWRPCCSDWRGRPFDAPERRTGRAGDRPARVGGRQGRHVAPAGPGPGGGCGCRDRAPRCWVAAAAVHAQPGRQASGTTRRVALPLLEILDRSGITVRHDADFRSVLGAPNPSKMATYPSHSTRSPIRRTLHGIDSQARSLGRGPHPAR